MKKAFLFLSCCILSLGSALSANAEDIYFTATTDATAAINAAFFSNIVGDTGTTTLNVDSGDTVYLHLWSDAGLSLDDTSGNPFGFSVGIDSSNESVVSTTVVPNEPNDVNSYNLFNPILSGGAFDGAQRWFSDLSLTGVVGLGDNRPIIDGGSGGNNPGVAPTTILFDPLYDSNQNAFFLGYAEITVSGTSGFTSLTPSFGDALSLSGSESFSGVIIAIPEPASATLLSAGLLGMLIRRRR